MLSNDYLNLANSQIKEASQWIKDYRANPEKYGSATTQNGSQSGDVSQVQQLLGNNTNSMMEMFQPLMVLMMFQILMQQIAPQSGINASNVAPPITAPYHPIQTGTPSSSDSSTTTSQTCINKLTTALESTDTPTEADLQALLDDWQANGLNETQFGQSVMYLLHQGDADTAAKLENWLPALFQSGALNPNPFLNAAYLDKLPNDRLAALSSSIASTGLSYADGAPNTSLISRLLSATTGDTSTTGSESTMSQDILYRLSQAAPDNAILANFLSISGFSLDENGILQGPYTLASQYTSQTV